MRAFAIAAVLFASTVFAADPPKRLAPPTDAAIEAATKRVRDTFKADYAKVEKTPSTRRAFAESLLKYTSDEKDPAVLYALLAESRSISATDGDLPATIRACAEMRKRFDLGEGCPGGLESIRKAAGFKCGDDVLTKALAAELADKPDPKMAVAAWDDVVAAEKGDAKLDARVRLCRWLGRVAGNLSGLEKAEIETKLKEAEAAVNAVEVKAGRFSLIEGVWDISYTNKTTRRYRIFASGRVEFVQFTTPEGKVEQASNVATLTRLRNGSCSLALSNTERETLQFFRDGVLGDYATSTGTQLKSSGTRRPDW